MAYSFSRSVTIDATKCGTADSTDFPVLVAGTYSYLATVANGGNVQSSSGYDIIFTSDSAGITPLNFERVAFTATTGAVVFWVKIPTVSHTSNTTFYIFYGDASVTTDQSNKTGTWETGYKAVYHLAESSNPYNDSTSNAVNSTGGTYPTQTTGLWGGKAQSFASASSQYIEFANPVTSGVVITISGWVKVSDNSLRILYDNRVNASLLGGVVYLDTSGANSVATFYYNNIGSVAGTTNMNDGNWHYLVGSSGIDDTPNRGPLYVDGVRVGYVVGAGSSSMTTGSARIGLSAGASPTGYMNGLIQEVRVADVIRTASWHLTEYNNQNSPSTFYTISGTSSSASTQPCFFLCM